jgi:hypothetical protein
MVAPKTGNTKSVRVFIYRRIKVDPKQLRLALAVIPQLFCPAPVVKMKKTVFFNQYPYCKICYPHMQQMSFFQVLSGQREDSKKFLESLLQP